MWAGGPESLYSFTTGTSSHTYNSPKFTWGPVYFSFFLFLNLLLY